LAESEDAVLLQRRARRRLVGAIALALFIIIVLPIVFDKEPRPITQDLVIEMPSENAGKFNPRLLPQPPAPAQAAAAPKPEAAAPEAAAPEAAAPEAAAPVPAAPPAAAPERTVASLPASPAPVAEASVKAAPAPTKAAEAPAKTAEAPAKTAEAPARIAAPARPAAGESFIVPLGAFSNPVNAKQVQTKVGAAGYKSYSEKLKGAKGEQLRVRAGPFATREAAEQAREKLKSLGFNPVGPVAAREQP
jgi:DedD protein